MTDSTAHPLHETLLHDALHAHVRESGAAAGPYLVGLADGALKVARRRQRLARAGAGIVAAVVVATAGVAVADGAHRQPHRVQPAAEGTGKAGKADLISILPLSTMKDHACPHGSGGYTVHATPAYPAFCIYVDRARGMTDVHAAAAKAGKGSIDPTWQVEVTLNSADRTRFAALTGSIAKAQPPRNQFAVVIDGKLWGAPMVRSALTAGRFEIAGPVDGDLTSHTAHDLALRLDPGR